MAVAILVMPMATCHVHLLKFPTPQQAMATLTYIAQEEPINTLALVGGKFSLQISANPSQPSHIPKGLRGNRTKRRMMRNAP
jgi:hypothetical protein